MDLNGRHVFVTGATGFLGRHLVDGLLARGANVTALVRATSDASHLRSRGVTLVEGDVTELETIDARGCEVFFHNAAWVGFGLLKKKRARMFETNVEGTRNALSAATRAGVRKFVLTSSTAVVGDTRGEVANEAFPRSPWYKSAYEQSKLEAHLLVQGSREGGFTVAMPMPGVILGHGGPTDRLIGSFARGKLPAIPRGDGPTGFVHVRDAAEGILLAAEKGEGPYLLVEDSLTMERLFEALAERWGVPMPRAHIGIGPLMAAATAVQGAYRLFGRTPPLSREHIVSLRAPMIYDSSRARDELGWRPRMWDHLAEERALYQAPPRRA